MSSYGPAGPPQPYGEPVDPFSGPTSPAVEQWGQPSAAPVPPYAGGYVPGQAVPPPQPVYQEDYGYQPQRRKASTLVVTLVVIFVVLALSGVALAVALMTSGDSDPSSGPCPSAATTDPHCFTQGKCLEEAGIGAGNAPLLREVASCAAESYKVVARFDGTYDVKRCDAVPETTRTYYFNATSGASSDLVLCLQKQPPAK